METPGRCYMSIAPSYRGLPEALGKFRANQGLVAIGVLFGCFGRSLVV